MTKYTITISMDGPTIDGLKDQGFSLYGFKAVKTSIKGGAPLVWFQTKMFLPDTPVIWSESYQAYISSTTIIPNGEIEASSSIDIDFGEKGTVDVNGVFTVNENGYPGMISILNGSSTPWASCGISQETAGVPQPMCAFPMDGNELETFIPIEKVFLMFATQTLNTGTVLFNAYTQGILIDLTGAQARSVNYDINNGWDWAGAPWGQSVEANALLVPMLIISS